MQEGTEGVEGAIGKFSSRPQNAKSLLNTRKLH